MTPLSLSEYTMPEKLALLESLWADLAGDENTLESPLWHEGVLKEREAIMKNGQPVVSDWEDAKERLRKKLS